MSTISGKNNLNEEKLLEQVFLLTNDPGSLRSFLETNQSLLSYNLAQKARAIANDAMQKSDFDFSKTAYLSASSLYLFVGHRLESLECFFFFWQICFMQAVGEKDYTVVRSGVLELLDKAEDVNSVNLIFQINLLAADSAFFASDTTQVQAQKMKWLLTCLVDLSQASKYLSKIRDCDWIERYVSLLSEAVSQVSSLAWLEDEQKQVDKLFSEITANTEKVISLDFDYKDASNLPKKFSTMEHLAVLSYEYGDPIIGSERYKILADHVSAVDTEFWLFVLSNWYAYERRFNGSALSDLRNTILSKIEAYRGTFRSRAGRLWCVQILESVLSEMLLDVLNNGTDEKIFELMEQLKSRTLLDYMENKAREFPNSEIETIAVNKERELLSFSPGEASSLLEFEIQILSRLPIGTYFDRYERDKQQNQVEEFYKKYQAGFSATAKTSTLSEIMSALSEGEVLIEYFMPPHRTHPSPELWIMAITRNVVKKIQVSLEDLEGIGLIGRISVDGRQPLDISPLGKLVTEIRVAIQEGNDVEAVKLLQKCYNVVITPLIKNNFDPKRFKRWIVVPHEVLHYLPFMALRSADSFLIEDVAITFSPSATIWHKLKKKQVEKISTFLGLGNPVLSAFDLKPLAEAEIEVNEISKILTGLNCTVFKNEDATESILRKEIKGKHIIHFATHGDFPEQDVIDSHRILLTPTGDHDGLLNAKELRTMDLHSAWLVVLSICNGGVYRCGPGNEPYGLVPALFIAGAQNILGSLWGIEDEAGRLYMVELYRHLIKNGPSEAVRIACSKFIQEKFPIQHWSSFVNVGTG